MLGGLQTAACKLCRSIHVLKAAQPEDTPGALAAGVLKKSLPVAGCIVEFAGGPGSWVARTYTATKGAAYSGVLLLL